jgi:hypothetical protein
MESSVGVKPVALDAPSIPEGARVTYRHYRCVPDGKGTRLVRYSKGDPLRPSDVLPRGGRTICFMHVDGKTYKGEAECSKKDIFCYRTGRALAFYRAVESYILA